MQYTTLPTIILSLLPSLLLASPLPNPTLPTRSTCTTIAPVYARISESQPTTPNLLSFLVSQSRGATYRENMLLEFFPPAGAHTCTLESYFPASFPLNAWGRQDLYVYSTDGHLEYSAPDAEGAEWATATWENSPKGVSQVGTIRLEAGTKKVVNSFKCEEVMTYRVEIGRDWANEEGGIRWEIPEDVAEGVEVPGFRMTYGC